MSSTLSSKEGDFDNYAAFDEAGSTTIGDSTKFRIRSKTAAASLSLADVKFENAQRSKSNKDLSEYSRDEFLYALSSPSSIGAIAWILTSFIAVIYGSSIVVYLNFCIPLCVGPYLIKEQMPAQLLPSVTRKYEKLRNIANTMSIKNVQLKGTVSKMQRQEYRLSVAEDRFEHLCQRGDKDIVKMKQLAKKNAALRQRIKMNLAGERLQELLKSMIKVDSDGNSHISQTQIQEVVSLMKVFAGKNASLKFDKDAVRRAVVGSMAKHMPNTMNDSVTEAEESYDLRKKYDVQRSVQEGSEENYSEMDITASCSQLSYSAKPDDDTREEDFATVSKDDDNESSFKSDPSGQYSDNRSKKEDFRSAPKKNLVGGGTADEPIDIEKILFANATKKVDGEKKYVGHHYQKNSKMLHTIPVSPME